MRQVLVSRRRLPLDHLIPVAQARPDRPVAASGLRPEPSDKGPGGILDSKGWLSARFQPPLRP